MSPGISRLRMQVLGVSGVPCWQGCCCCWLRCCFCGRPRGAYCCTVMHLALGMRRNRQVSRTLTITHSMEKQQPIVQSVPGILHGHKTMQEGRMLHYRVVGVLLIFGYRWGGGYQSRDEGTSTKWRASPHRHRKHRARCAPVGGPILA